MDDAFVGKQVATVLVLEDLNRAARVRNRTDWKWGMKQGCLTDFCGWRVGKWLSQKWS